MRKLARLFCTVALVGCALPASAQQPACTARNDVISHLASKYNEKPVALGLANNGGVIEVITSKGGDTWTIIITMPNGTSCMIAAGEHCENLPKTLLGDPAT